MFTKVSVLVPTRQRVERLRTLLTSYERTAVGASELIFRADDDDRETRNFLLDYGRHRVIVGRREQGYKSMPLFFNELLAASTGDVLMCGNDDMVFKTPSWDRWILDAANQFPDGVFDIGVMTHNEAHFPFSVVSRRATDAIGFLWDPRIFWGDIFLRDTMAAFGRCVMLPSVEIEHDWAGNRPDQVFREADKDITRSDPTYWMGTHARAVNDAVHKLQGLLS